ncbi:MAG: beta-ketoacyl synthase chain length factor [Deltaproteobacteria bacterium]|nr:beta-ketoacyl synthase chain length factor [Deltaproteobacteria bacterium]
MKMRVLTVGVWLPGIADSAVWLSGAHTDTTAPPLAAVLPPMTRRRCSVLTRALADVFAQVTDRVDRAHVASVFASAYGETAVLGELLDQLALGEGLSPIRFSGSVHNAAAGQVSIVCENRAFTTSVAAGRDTVAMGLLEAQALLCDGAPQVAVVLGDVAPPPSLSAERYGSLAAGLLVDAAPSDGDELATLVDLMDDAMLADAGALPVATWTNPCCGGLLLVDTVLRQRNMRIGLGPHGVQGWGVDVTFPRPPPPEAA